METMPVKSLIIYVFLLFIVSITQGQVIEIQDTFTSVELKKQIKILPTNDSLPEIQNALKADNLSKFQEIPAKGISYGMGNLYAFWLRFEVKNVTNKTVSLVFNTDQSKLNYVQFYSIDSLMNISTTSLTGDYTPFSTRPILYRNFSFPIQLKPYEHKKYYLFADQRGEGTYMIPILFSTNAFIEYLSKKELSMGIFMGIWLIILLISIALWVMEKTKTLFFYAFYVVTVVGLYISFYGIGNQYIWTNDSTLPSIMVNVFQCFNMFAILNMFRHFLKLPQQFPKADRIIKFLVALTLGMGSTLFFYKQMTINLRSVLLFAAVSCSILTTLSMYGISYLLYKKHKHKEAIWFSISFSMSFIIVVLGLPLFLFFPGTVDAISFIFVGFVVDLFCFLALFSTNMYKVRLEHELQKNELITARQTALENLITGQQAERQRIAQRLHDGMSLLLASIKMRFSSAVSKLPPSVSEQYFLPILNDLRFASQEIRNISHDLDPTSIHTGKLVESLQDTLSRTQFFNPDLILTFHTEGFDENQLSHPTRMACFYIVQELIYNAVKYADCAKIDVQLTTENQSLLLSVSDNGVGYDPSLLHKGFGLRSIESRVRLLQGDLQIIKNTEGGDVAPSCVADIDFVTKNSSFYLTANNKSPLFVRT